MTQLWQIINEGRNKRTNHGPWLTTSSAKSLRARLAFWIPVCFRFNTVNENNNRGQQTQRGWAALVLLPNSIHSFSGECCELQERMGMGLELQHKGHHHSLYGLWNSRGPYSHCKQWERWPVELHGPESPMWQNGKGIMDASRLKKSKEKKVNCYSLEPTNTQRVVIEGQLQKWSLCLCSIHVSRFWAVHSALNISISSEGYDNQADGINFIIEEGKKKMNHHEIPTDSRRPLNRVGAGCGGPFWEVWVAAYMQAHQVTCDWWSFFVSISSLLPKESLQLMPLSPTQSSPVPRLGDQGPYMNNQSYPPWLSVRKRCLKGPWLQDPCFLWEPGCPGKRKRLPALFC